MAVRFFVEGVCNVGDVVALEGGDARKITTVLRLRQGASIEAIDSAAQRFRATIVGDAPDVRARLDELLVRAERSGPRIVVAQGIPKGQKMDFVVEKLTELGVDEILPLQSERAIAEAGDAKRDRWRRLARTAAQQCGRSDIPEIGEAISIDELARRCRGVDLALVPWELAEPVPLREILPGLLDGARTMLVAIGPEGGFGHDEVAVLRAAGARPISLGPRILRTETAAMALLAVLNYASEPAR